MLTFDDERIINTTSLNRVVENYPELMKKRRGLPHTGRRFDGAPFFSDLEEINSTFVYSNSLYQYEDLIDKSLTLINAGMGSPMETKPFPPISRAIKKVPDEISFSQYQLAAGDENCRKEVARYFSKEGFIRDDRTINENNVVFTNSTTEAFDFILKIITKPYDVVLFTGPTYGLFVYLPERINAISRVIPLRAEDNWKINPIRLKKEIEKINYELKNRYSHLNYIPRVVAFVNVNPSNPTGVVMGESDKNRLVQVGKVCNDNGVFIIDDIIYRDLCFDREKKACPIATIPNMFSNTITITGISKSYGAAGARAGIVLADEIIIRGIRNQIFQHMDSTSLQVNKMLASAFSDNAEREKDYERYFGEVIDKYKFKWNLLKSLICGLNSIEKEYIESIVSTIENIYGFLDSRWFDPIDEIKIVDGLEPQSGFFAMLDLTGILGKSLNGQTIKDELDVMHFYYMNAYVKLLMGSSVAWPDKDKIVSRVSFSISDKEIIVMIKQMKDAIKKLD